MTANHGHCEHGYFWDGCPTCDPRYVVKVGPDEYSAMRGTELGDGSLSWVDTAGVPHTAPSGTWRKE